MFKAPPSKRLKPTITLSAGGNDAPSSSLDVAGATEQLLAAQDAETRQTAARAHATACDNTDDDDKNASGDAIRPLAEMMRGSSGEAEAGALALRKLAINSEYKVSIAAAGAIPLLVALLQNGSDMVKVKAVGALGNLAYNNYNKVSIAEAGAIPPLVALLQNGTDAAEKKRRGGPWRSRL